MKVVNAISLISGLSHISSEHGYARLLTILTTALLFTGCAMVGPDFQKPEATVSEAWSDVDELAIVTESTEHREWWKNFNDPTLDTLIQMAYEQSLTLQIAVCERLAAAIIIIQAPSFSTLSLSVRIVVVHTVPSIATATYT